MRDSNVTQLFPRAGTVTLGAMGTHEIRDELSEIFDRDENGTPHLGDQARARELFAEREARLGY